MFKLLVLAAVIGGLLLDQLANDGAVRRHIVARALADAASFGQIGDRNFTIGR